MKCNVTFPKTWEDLYKQLQQSTYLGNLQARQEEQVWKNKVSLSDANSLAAYYASSSLYTVLSDQSVIKKAVTHLFDAYPLLPFTNVSFVVINPRCFLEFGNTSFTINSVVFLHHQKVQDPQTIVHECLHVIQRQHPQWFGKVCAKLGFYTLETTPDAILCKGCVLNPDEDSILLGQDGVYVSYDRHLRQRYTKPMRTNGVVVKPTYPPSYHLLGVAVKYDSLYEMFAVRLSMYVDNEKLRQQVNDFLRSV